MAGDLAILKRIRACPFARGGRVLVRFRANADCLFARRSGEPLARLRLTGHGDEVVLLYPSHRGGWRALGDFGASAVPLDEALQCLSAKPYFLELRQTYRVSRVNVSIPKAKTVPWKLQEEYGSDRPLIV